MKRILRSERDDKLLLQFEGVKRNFTATLLNNGLIGGFFVKSYQNYSLAGTTDSTAVN